MSVNFNQQVKQQGVMRPLKISCVLFDGAQSSSVYLKTKTKADQALEKYDSVSEISNTYSRPNVILFNS